MSYYSGMGDYYSGVGDPGLFGSIAKVLGGGLSTLGSVLPGPLGSAAKIGGGILGKITGGTKAVRPPPAPIQVPTPVPGIRGAAQRIVPGGQSGYTCPSGACGPGFHLDKATNSRCVRNRRTNYTNPRALARASKRVDGFVKVARKALKNSNYKVVPKSYKQNYRKPLKR